MDFSPKVNLEVFSCLNNYGHLTRDQKLKIKEIGDLVANLLYLNKQIGISERR